MIDEIDVKNSKENEKITAFSKLIDKIEYANAESKLLWKEIYRNAIDDRTYALLLYTDLYTSVNGSTDGHQINGKQISQYLERMNKSNDQLLKLAELISNVSGGDGELDAESLYDEIAKK